MRLCKQSRKKRYDNWQLAEKARLVGLRRYGNPTTVYYCDACNGYHLTRAETVKVKKKYKRHYRRADEHVSSW